MHINLVFFSNLKLKLQFTTTIFALPLTFLKLSKKVDPYTETQRSDDEIAANFNIGDSLNRSNKT